MLLCKSRGPPAFGFFARRSHPTFAATALGGLLVAASTGSALSHGCMPNHARPLVILKDMGPCSFGDRKPVVLFRPLPAAGKAKRYIIAIVDDDRAPLDKFCKKLTPAG